jgi:RNA polymerase sigma-70 factor (ECF subfamily)
MFENDLDLLTGLKNDDEIAFKVLFNKYYPRLYYFILEFVPFADLAENIVQDTFVALWTKRKELNDNTNFGAYLYTVAKNNCIYRLRDQKYSKKLFAETDPDQAELETNLEVLSSVDTSAFTFEEINRIIHETLDRLPPQCRKVFLLRFEEKKNREIAGELNISVKVVEKHISKGLKIFKIALKDYLPFISYLITP